MIQIVELISPLESGIVKKYLLKRSNSIQKPYGRNYSVHIK